jgi:hypothetical protein
LTAVVSGGVGFYKFGLTPTIVMATFCKAMVQLAFQISCLTRKHLTIELSNQFLSIFQDVHQ